MKDLWASKRSGRRRTGTRVSELRRLFETGITVRAVEEPLQCCLSSDPAPLVSEKMRQLDFDVVGFKDSEEGPVMGYVNGCDLGEGECREYFRAFLFDSLLIKAV